MTPITNVEEREQWRARINRALAELQTDTTHLEGGARMDEPEQPQQAEV